MSIYTYKCEFCGIEFEKELTIKEFELKKKVKCPNCGGKKVKRVIKIAPPVIYKSSGFTLKKGDE